MSTGNLEVKSLPGVFAGLVDSGLAVEPYTRGVRTLVLGTADKGAADFLYTVTSSAAAASEYGNKGTLTRGMYEVRQGGAENAILYRMGATSAKLSHVGDSTGVGGYTIETYRKDDDAGSIYSIYYDDSADRLIIWNVVSGLAVYDNDSVDPIDLEEVIISGYRAAGGGPDIAGPSAGFLLEDVVGLGHPGTSYVAGTDGTTPSRMELFEYLQKAYAALMSYDFDYVVPMDVYLDDKNLVDGYSFSPAYLASIVVGDEYPDPGGIDDILGRVYYEEYEGRLYFFWDLDADGVAELFPVGVGLASATTKTDGTSLSAADFHEVNFAYQLARFCAEVSVNNNFVLGVIGTRPPASRSVEDIARWVGKSPVYTTRSDGTQYIARVQDNGTGLLGNKFKAGKYGFRGGVAYGGFILTDTDFCDGVEQTDINGFPIDIGAYLSLVTSFVRLFNAFDLSGRGYIATSAPTYMGYVSSLDEQQAPTNKVMRGVYKVISLGQRQVDNLATAGYICLFDKPRGLTWSDAPTGARPTCDYRRLVTMRVVKRAVRAVRDACDPFLGNAFNPAKRAAMQNAITQALDKLVKGGYIVRHESTIKQTGTQKVLGKADIDLMLVPSWELRRITLTVSLQPQ